MSSRLKPRTKRPSGCLFDALPFPLPARPLQASKERGKSPLDSRTHRDVILCKETRKFVLLILSQIRPVDCSRRAEDGPSCRAAEIHRPKSGWSFGGTQKLKKKK